MAFAVVCGHSSSYVGVAGSIEPQGTWQRLPVLDALAGASASSAAVRRFLPDGAVVVVTVSATATRGDRERIVDAVFRNGPPPAAGARAHGASSVASSGAAHCLLIPEPLACCYATGRVDGATAVVDIGATHVTCSLVEDGCLSRFVSSASLRAGLDGGASPAAAAALCSRWFDCSVAAPLGAGGEGAPQHHPATTVPSLLRRLLSHESKGTGSPLVDCVPDGSLLAVGGGFEIAGALTGLRRALRSGAPVPPGPRTAGSDADTDLPLVALTTPALTSYLGASLFASLLPSPSTAPGSTAIPGVSRQQYLEEGAQAVHWRCPG